MFVKAAEIVVNVGEYRHGIQFKSSVYNLYALGSRRVLTLSFRSGLINNSFIVGFSPKCALWKCIPFSKYSDKGLALGFGLRRSIRFIVKLFYT
jgi:hypothetical protein